MCDFCFLTLFIVSAASRPVNIGVASYGALGHVPRPLNFQLFIFSGPFRVAQALTFDSMWTQ